MEKPKAVAVDLRGQQHGGNAERHAADPASAMDIVVI
jgi:hypothetical protein